MTVTHKELKRLTGFQIFAHSQDANLAVLQLTTDSEEFLCVVTREILLKLSAAFEKHADLLSRDE